MARVCACRKWPAFKVDDIDSTRMLILIEQGKGRKDDNAMLSPQLIAVLRLWWQEGKRRSVMLPHGWLFPGRGATDPISTRADQPARSMRQPKWPGSGSGCRPIRCAMEAKPLHLLEQDVDILRHPGSARNGEYRPAKHLIEGRIYHRSHPRCGETVLIKLAASAYCGIGLVVILQSEAACSPAFRHA